MRFHNKVTQLWLLQPKTEQKREKNLQLFELLLVQCKN